MAGPSGLERDVIVIGAGPAGCAAAIQGALSGLGVTLLEREPFPRERPGETLHPGVEPLFQALGVREAVLARPFLRHEGHWVAWRGPERFAAFGGDAGGPWRGFQARRAELDEILLRRARDLGVEVLQSCRPAHALIGAGRVVGVATDAGRLESRFVVDATGSAQWLRRQLRIAAARCSPRLVAWYGYCVGDCPARDAAPRIAADAQGWTWSARVGAGLYAWARLSPGDPSRPPDARPPELRALRPRGRTRGAEVTWRVARCCAGPGYFITGDAAATLDPASSHGVLRALMSGMLAADRIAQVRRGSAGEAAASRDYDQWLRRWFEHDVERLSGMYQMFPAWTRASPPAARP